jgi:hypothetical protein
LALPKPSIKSIELDIVFTFAFIILIYEKYCFCLRMVCALLHYLLSIYLYHWNWTYYNMTQVHILFMKRNTYIISYKKTLFFKLHMIIIITQSFTLNKPTWKEQTKIHWNILAQNIHTQKINRILNSDIFIFN